MNLHEQKKAARVQAGAIRKAAHERLAEQAALALAGHVFPAQPQAGASIVSAFYPYKSEIDTRPLLGKLAADGWTTSLPIIIGPDQPLVFRRWYPGEPTIPGDMNIPRPRDEVPKVEPDVLIVPMLAFDAKGYRLGYGGGFYDRTIALLRSKKKIIAIGAAYSAQQVDEVPHGEHDQPLDYVMTEVGVLTCG